MSFFKKYNGTSNLRLHASGLVGDILDLLNDNLATTIQDVTTRSAAGGAETERGRVPMKGPSRHCSVMRPSGATAVASTISRPAPPRARLV